MSWDQYNTLVEGSLNVGAARLRPDHLHRGGMRVGDVLSRIYERGRRALLRPKAAPSA